MIRICSLFSGAWNIQPSSVPNLLSLPVTESKCQFLFSIVVELLVQILFCFLGFFFFYRQRFGSFVNLFCYNRHFRCDHYPELSFVPIPPLVLIMTLIVLPLEKTIYLYILDKSFHPGNQINNLELKNNPFIQKSVFSVCCRG